MTTDERIALEVYEAMRTKKGKHLEENIEDEDEDIPMDENDDTGNFCEYHSIFLFELKIYFLQNLETLP